MVQDSVHAMAVVGTSEAARVAEVSAETIRLWERAGKLPAMKRLRAGGST